MEEKSYKQAVRSAFDEAASGYDLPAMRFFDQSASFLAENLQLNGSEHVLDAATGTGKVAFAVCSRLKNGRVTAVDLSHGMLARARVKADGMGITNVIFKESDVDGLEFNEGSFDGLTCGFGVHFWQEMTRSLAALIRLVRPGGFIALTNFSKGSFEPVSDRILRRFKSFGVILPDSYTWERLDHPDKVEALLKPLGIKEIQSHHKQIQYVLNGPEQWWDLVRYTGFRAFLNQLSSEQADVYRSEYLSEMAADARRTDGVQLNVGVILTTGRK